MSAKSLRELIESEIRSGKLELPVFNRTALQLQQLIRSGTTSIDQVAKVLMQDQALASRLLMLANSAFYSGLRRVETVSAAVIRLGTRVVANLAFAASQSMAHQSTHALIAPRMPTLWKRAFLSAIGSEWLVRNCKLGIEPEAAFLCGLLHDVGELYLLKVAEKLLSENQGADTLTPALLDEVLEAMHNQVGYDVMRKWDLPDAYARVARDHHAAEYKGDDVLMTLCRLMDHACLKLGLAGEPDADFQLAATLEAQLLGLSDIKAAQLEIHLEDAIAGAAEFR